MKMKTIYIYSVFLAWCFLGFSSYAQETPQTIEIKIDFAKVQDVSGDQPNKTAACIIAWVADDAEEKVFCRYQLEKETGFLRDTTGIDRILYKNRLLTATPKTFPKKIKDWLDDIEKGLSGKKLPPIQPTISQLFAEFSKQGVKDYSAYSGYKEGLFKSTMPYDLVLSPKLDDSDVAFAFIVHYEVHRAVSAKPDTPQTSFNNTKPTGGDDNSFIERLKDKIDIPVVILLAVCGVLLLLLLVLQNTKKSQRKILEAISELRTKPDKPIEEQKHPDISTEKLLAQLTKQKGTWQWLQNILVGQYQAYQKAVHEVQTLHEPEYDKILKLLNIENILTHWRDFIKDSPHSDQKLQRHIHAMDSGMWLHNILRADELLKTYFSDKPQLKPLTTHLTYSAIILQAALQELGIEIIKPVLLETPPATLPQSARKKAENHLLMELVHGKVMPKLEKTGKLVVDIERYGFVTQGTHQTAMKVLVAELGGWEFFQT
jgi:hypothetical protein